MDALDYENDGCGFDFRNDHGGAGWNNNGDGDRKCFLDEGIANFLVCLGYETPATRKTAAFFLMCMSDTYTDFHDLSFKERVALVYENFCFDDDGIDDSCGDVWWDPDDWDDWLLVQDELLSSFVSSAPPVPAPPAPAPPAPLASASVSPLAAAPAAAVAVAPASAPPPAAASAAAAAALAPARAAASSSAFASAPCPASASAVAVPPAAASPPASASASASAAGPSRGSAPAAVSSAAAPASASSSASASAPAPALAAASASAPVSAPASAPLFPLSLPLFPPVRWFPASASVSALASSSSPSPLSLLLFLLLFFVLFFLSLFLPWFGWDPGWILHSTLLLLSVAGFFVFITGVGFVALLRLVDGVMDLLQTCDTEDCAWMTLEDLYCEISWGFSSLILPYSARFHRVSPTFFTYKLPGSCFVNGPRCCCVLIGAVSPSGPSETPPDPCRL